MARCPQGGGAMIFLSPQEMSHAGEMEVEDIIQIRGGKREPGKAPSRGDTINYPNL